MDDMDAFDRQIAGGLDRMAGPGRHIDAMAMVRTASTQSPKWRFQSMFSATKFVVAGALVALFGGLLFTGVLTQPSDEQSPPAVGASASAEAEPTEVTTTEPEPTAEAVADRATPDLLPGVDLVTEEVAPGVYRVLSDGERDLSKNVWRVAVRSNGEVWVEKYRIAGYGGQGVDPGDPRIRNQRWHRLGDPESYNIRPREAGVEVRRPSVPGRWVPMARAGSSKRGAGSMDLAMTSPHSP